uniref:ABC transporter permease n=1 Tax=Thaumasiovibrio occultus TaxID=1891184 RepID=UPI000B358B6F|nr:FtsX-like permease family protein [Thaumasiovibrio occultus]
MSYSSRGLIWHWRWRELRQGQLWSVVFAIALIVGAVCALASLALRIEMQMTQQGRAILAADRVLVTSAEPEWLAAERAQLSDVTISQQLRFRTMAFSDNGMQLISVKAVDSLFPLRGELQLGAQSHVNPGELWLESQLMMLLDVQPGDWVEVGDARLQVTGEIGHDPELSFNPFNQMLQALIHWDDVEETGAIQLGSRSLLRTYFRGDDATLAQLEQRHPAAPGVRWLSEETEGRTGDLLVKAKQYLSLSVVLVVIMSAATLALACYHFARSRQEQVGMLKSLGASRGWLARWLLAQSLWLLIVGSVLGIGFSVLLERALALPLAGMLPQALPSAGATPVMLGLLVATVVAIPAMGIPLLALLRTPLSAIRRQAPLDHRWSDALLMLPLALAAAMGFGDNVIVLVVLLGLVVMMALLGAAGYAMVWMLSRLPFTAAAALALSRIRRSPLLTGMQLAAMATSLMLISVLWLLKSELLAEWDQTIPDNAPNVFALNVAPSERDAYLATLDAANITRSEAYPVIRGRVTAVNNTPIETWVATHPEADELRRREMNLTWRDAIPSHNELLAGEWRDDLGVSIESGVAERLGIGLGDEVSFTVASQSVTVPITSIRHVEWRNMRPNFYFIFPEQAMASFPQTWLLSFELSDEQSPVLEQISRDFPTVSIMDLRTMVTRVQGLLAEVTNALTVLAGVAVVSGLLLVLTLLLMGISQRQLEVKLYRTLGASSRLIRASLLVEYGVVAAVAALIAVFGAELALALVMDRFALVYQWHPMLWITLPVASITLVYLGLASTLRRLLIPVTQ